MIYDDDNDNETSQALYNEYKYVLDFLSSESSEIILHNEKVINSKKFLEDALETMKHISSHKGYYKYIELINNAPIFLYEKKTKKIISYLLSLGLSENEIIKLLCTSFDKCVEFSEKARDTLPINDDFYYQLVNKSEDGIKKGVITPESYKFRVKRIMNEHEDLLRRLK